MLQVSVTVSGTKEVQGKLRKLGQELYMLQGAMESIGESLSKYYRDVAFASQGGVFGAAWPRLSPQYAARKAKQYPGRSPLVRTGKMQRGFDYDASRNSVTIFNESDHFVYHQSTAPRKKIPRRQMIGVNTTVKNTVKVIMEKEIAAKIRRAGL